MFLFETEHLGSFIFMGVMLVCLIIGILTIFIEKLISINKKHKAKKENK